MPISLYQLRCLSENGVVEYSTARLFFDGRRKGMGHRRAGSAVFLAGEGDQLLIRHYREATPFAAITPDGTFEFLREPNCLSESMLVWFFTKVVCYSHVRRRVKNRFYLWLDRTRTPVGKGSKVLNGVILNPDHVPILREKPTKEGKAAWRKLYAPIAPAIAALVRMEDFEAKGHPYHLTASSISIFDALETIAEGEPALSSMIAFGARATRRNRWRRDYDTAYWSEYRERLVNNVRRVMREAFYSARNAFETVTEM